MSSENPVKTILVMSANPKGTNPLRLSEEIRDIKAVLRRAKRGDRFRIESAEASRYRDIQDSIMHYDPQIIHFSGHGAGEAGLIFEDNTTGQQKLVDTEALAQMFKLLATRIEFVVLNACYSEIQALAIAQHINYVIGMSEPIGDRSAIEFAVGFYQALGHERDVEEAYKWGCNAIQIAGMGEHLTPKLLRKEDYFRKNYIDTIPVPTSPPQDARKTKPFEFETATLEKNLQITRSRRRAESFKEDLGNGVFLEMVEIPGGSFLMGSPENELERIDYESPQHPVNIQPFFMGKFQVTQKQYEVIMGENPSYFKGEKKPVECVTWNNAVEFCGKISKMTGKTYRLPSEAEWEYACRAGTTTPFHFGKNISTDLANYRGTDWNYEGQLYPGNYGSGSKGEYREQTTDVGIFPANAFGLYDMHGNVFEWCQDNCHDNYKGAPNDGSAWVIYGNDNDNYYRVLRGGSWLNNPRFCRSASRFGYECDFRYFSFGFRVVFVSPRAS